MGEHDQDSMAVATASTVAPTPDTAGAPLSAVLRFDEGTLVLEPASLPDEVVPPGFQRDRRAGGRFRALACAYRDAHLYLREHGVTVTDAAADYEKRPFVSQLERVPFEHQVDALRCWWAAGGRGLVVLPTGAGKSYLAILAIERAKRSALVVVPTINLLTQWVEVLRGAFGEPVGAIGGGQFEVLPLTVVTYDSASNHMARLGNRFGLIVFDECHHLPAPKYSLAAELSIAPFRLGLTATPERADGSHELLDRLLGHEVFRVQRDALVGDILAEYELVVFPVPLSEAERLSYDDHRAIFSRWLARQPPDVRKRGFGEIRKRMSSTAEGRQVSRSYEAYKAILQTAEAKYAAIADILADHDGEKAIVFTDDNRTILDISRRMLIPVITHHTPKAERVETLARLAAGTYRVVGTSHVLNEGVDMPDVSIGIIVSGSASTREFTQRVGRLLRRAENKRAVCYELVAMDTVEESTSERRRGEGQRPEGGR
ncbi:MAG: DEAD/DEAH box helicase family protein [Myxococcales bacterium]|nr:DEAD/DEAH box helicase family protein [Myxococcales bacterium]